MQKRNDRRRLASIRFSAAAACALALTAAGQVHAVVIDVGLANFSTTATTGNSTNGGINPITYTPAQVTVPYAPSVMYDAADKTDSGTIWNSIQSVSTAPTSSVSSVLYQQNLPLVDSTGASTTAQLNVSAIEGPGKLDSIHTTSNVPSTAGSDGLLPNPANSTYLVSSVATNGNGYAASNVQRLLMGNEWVANGASDGMSIQLTGLTAYAGDTFSLYVYGAGSAAGQGGLFTLAAGNGGGAVSTNSTASGRFLSVFDSSGIDPAPEKTLSWNLLTGTVDSSGNVAFTVTATASGLKPSANGFQLDIAVPVPEPTSAGLLAIGSVGLLGRRRRKQI
jgi:hypothetical protein